MMAVLIAVASFAFPGDVASGLTAEFPKEVAANEIAPQPLHELAVELQREIKRLQKEVAEQREALAAQQREIDRLTAEVLKFSQRGGGSGGAIPAGEVEFVRCVIESADNCIPCQRLWDGINRELPPLGWQVGKDYVLEKVTEMEVGKVYPSARIESRGRVLERLTGVLSPAILSHRLRYHRDRSR